MFEVVVEKGSKRLGRILPLSIIETCKDLVFYEIILKDPI